MKGDILFYKGGPDLPDRLICWCTHGPYVHCEVDLGDGTAIGSHWRTGVRRHPVDVGSVPYRLDTSPDRIEAGITWLQCRVGDPYGIVDILDQIFTLILPRSPIAFISQRHGFDCSDLVARYVDIAGGLNLGLFRDTPNLCTPNDLARLCGLSMR